jgi:hypothetical protein
MTVSRLRPVLAAAALLAAVAACTQNPQFRMNLANQSYGSLNELYVLLAKADLGTLRSPSSFADEADSYAMIIGGFELGRLLARPTGSPPGAGSLDDLDRAIRQCVGQLTQMSDRHRTSGIVPGSPTIRTVRERCDAAARSVAADEVSSWIFSTAAGDL